MELNRYQALLIALYVFCHLIIPTAHETGTIIMPIEQMWMSGTLVNSDNATEEREVLEEFPE